MDATPIDILSADFIIDTSVRRYGKNTMGTSVYPGMLIIVDGVAYKAANERRIGCSGCCFDVRTAYYTKIGCGLYGSKPFECSNGPKTVYPFSPLSLS